MGSIDISMCAGIGDAIFYRGLFDQLKLKYDQINISFLKHFIITCRQGNVEQYWKFLNNFGRLIFSDKQFNLVEEDLTYFYIDDLVTKFNLTPAIPDLTLELCNPSYYNGLQKYIVITTKLRLVPRPYYEIIKEQLFLALKKLSEKYIIVVLGEREIELNNEYAGHGEHKIFSIYNDIIDNILTNRILDMTFKCMGITVPVLENIQNDCCIFRDAEFVINIGFGGPFCLSVATGNVMCLNVIDCYTPWADSWLMTGNFPKLFITKSFPEFYDEMMRRSV